MKSATAGSPIEISALLRAILLRNAVQSVPITLNRVPLYMEFLVTEVQNALSESTHAMTVSFVYKSLKKLLQI
jgi:hypothetical protein